METKVRSCGLFVGGLFLGSLVGGAVALFFAPKPGEELRSEIKHQGEKALGEAKKLYSEAETKAKTFLEDAKHVFTAQGSAPRGSDEEMLWEA